MKRILISLLLVASTTLISAQENHDQMVCSLGFTYEISQSANWAKGKPVVKVVQPGTSAAEAGLKQNDYIEEINGKSVYGMGMNELKPALNVNGEDAVVLTVKNLAGPSHKVLITKNCKLEGTITEDQLADAFSMYSLETTGDVDFTCPFKLVVTPDAINFGDFHTFAFASIDENNRQMETTINEYIKKALTDKGLTVDTKNPDMTVQTFYFFDKNPNYKGTTPQTRGYVYRYDIANSKMMQFPFMENANEADAPYLLQLGVRLIDRQYVPGRVIWECEANELLLNSYRLEDYARVHIPLMFMQYPYAKYKNNARFHVSRRSYNYTGISYDIDKLDYVVAIDEAGPAYFAGIRKGDIIEKIGRQKMNHSAEEFSEAYKHFISYTMSQRDPTEIYTDSNGFTYCMYWNPMNYAEVSDAVKKPENMAAFAYLYYFEPYMNLSGNNECTFTVNRDKTSLAAIIRPEVRSSATIEVK